jgi:hypothetical protein
MTKTLLVIPIIAILLVGVPSTMAQPSTTNGITLLFCRLVDGYGLKYVLMHYATIVLEILNGEVIICSAKTASSKRTANQALAYLECNKDVKQIKNESNEPKEVFI